MTTIEMQEAKDQFDEIMKKVNEGEQYTITENGVPMAEIGPAEKQPKEKRKQPFDEDTIRDMYGKPISEESLKKAHQKIKEMRKNCRLDGLKIKDMIEEGRA